MNKVKLKPEFVGNKYFKSSSKEEILKNIVSFFKISHFRNSTYVIVTRLAFHLKQDRFFNLETRHYYPDVESADYYYPLDLDNNTVEEISGEQFEEQYKLAIQQLIFY